MMKEKFKDPSAKTNKEDQDLSENISKFVEGIENKIKEIKDSNQFIIPEVIRVRYSNIYSYNVFSVMKKYKTDRMIFMQDYINVSRIIEERRNETVTVDDHKLPLPIQQDMYSDPVSDKSLFPFKLEKKKNMDIEVKRFPPKLDIYDPKLSLNQLKKHRDFLLESIIRYRNFGEEMNEIFQSEIDKYNNIRKPMRLKFFSYKCGFCPCCPDLLGCLKT